MQKKEEKEKRKICLFTGNVTRFFDKYLNIIYSNSLSNS